MNQKSRDVLEAAERWLMAVQAKTAADGELRRDESEQAELDAAEVDLATAIMVWRMPGGQIRCYIQTETLPSIVT